MSLPSSLYHAIEKILDAQNLSGIRQARRVLTQRYHDLAKEKISDASFIPQRFQDVSRTKHDVRHSNSLKDEGHMRNDAGRLSYLATRMPATYEVCLRVLGALSDQANRVTSLLDLGAGPGTVVWAAQDLFPNLEQVTLVEKDRGFIHLGARLFDETLEKKHMTWLNSSLKDAIPFQPHALVTLSYVLGELSIADQEYIVNAGWEATKEFFVLIEPGTPRGFERIKQARHQLIQQGAFVVAPCPHEAACPMVDKDWCHFSQRLERTSLHRLIKEASLAYEDEKYSYIIVSRNPLHDSLSRIVRKPRHGSGHFILDLCTRDGLKRLIVSRKTGKLYRMARHLEWGDPGPKLDDA
jgi:ribosomal protein RSM22 (predicted rRNA methylase)